MEAAQLQQLQERVQQLEQELSACQSERAVLRGTVVRLECELRSARYEVEDLEQLLASARRSTEEQAAERLRTRQRDSAAAAVVGTQVTELERQLADCQAQLRGCRAELVKLQAEASRRRSSGGSHPGEQQQQQQQQPHQQQPEGQPAGGAAVVGSGGSAAAMDEGHAAGELAPGEAGLKAGMLTALGWPKHCCVHCCVELKTKALAILLRCWALTHGLRHVVQAVMRRQRQRQAALAGKRCSPQVKAVLSASPAPNSFAMERWQLGWGQVACRAVEPSHCTMDQHRPCCAAPLACTCRYNRCC